MTVIGIYIIFLPCKIDLKFSLSLSQRCKADTTEQGNLLAQVESVTKPARVCLLPVCRHPVKNTVLAVRNFKD